MITGASGLIGQELCREFLNDGYHVYGFDLRPSELKHSEYTHFKGNVSKEADVKRAFKGIKQLDVLINNAAKASPHQKPLEKLTLKEWNDLLSVDLTSVFLFSRSAIPLLKKAHGKIINMSSTRHKMSQSDTEVYSTAKGGIDALSRAMSVSLGPEILVNTISPGWIADPAKDQSLEDHAQHPAGRVGRPSDIATMALYLASDKADFITGQDFVIDGGMTAKMIYVE